MNYFLIFDMKYNFAFLKVATYFPDRIIQH